MSDAGGDGFSERVRLEATFEPAVAGRIEQSLRVEAADLADERTRTRIERTDETLAIEIAATDLVGLRAASNTWLGLLETAEDTAAALTDRV